jgi:hypothetical protein
MRPNAVIASWARDVRDHKWLAVRAILVGWAALIVLWLVTVRLVNLDDWLFARGLADLRAFWPDPRRPFFHFLIGGLVNAAAAWIVGRFHRAYWTPMVLVFFASLVIYDLTRFIPAAMASWSSGRFWGIVTLDILFMRLPMIAVALWGVRGWPRVSADEQGQA